MLRPAFLFIVSSSLALAGLSLGAAPIPAHQAISQYVDATSCTVCHQSSAGQVMHTTHWTWQHTEADGRVLGKNNVINNYCVALASNEPRCTSCHAGVGYKDKTFDFSNARAVDCLVCHDTTGTYKKHPTMAGAAWTGPGTNIFNGVAYPPLNLTFIAQNVGKSSRSTCGACHFFGGGGDAVKHGDLDSSLARPNRQLDVHMGTDSLNFVCADCHKTTEHRIPGSYYTKDHPDSQSCESCHTSQPHKTGTVAARLNSHTGRVGCQSCHIPAYARGRTTTLTWDWSTAGTKDTNGVNMVIKNSNGDTVYDTQKGTFTWGKNVRPEYVWFNGTVDYMTADDAIDPSKRVQMNRLHGDFADPKSRILPVKHFTGKQPYDRVYKKMIVPHLFGSDTNAYWKGFNWTNAAAAGMAYIGQQFSGEIGWVETDFYWIENHMVAPKTNAVGCAECHTAQDGRMDFSALGYAPERVSRLQNLSLLTGSSHVGRFGASYTAGNCGECHPSQVNEVLDSVHYTWRTPNARLAYPGGGSHGMIDRFCALVGSSAMINYFADLGDHKGSSACGKCHVGNSLPFPNPVTGLYTQDQRNGIDCLLCHAKADNYDMNGDGVYDTTDAEATHRALKTDAAGRRYWFSDKSLRAAESVGERVDTESCLRCHEHGQADPNYKRGTPFRPEHDVHAAAGMNCTDCHKASHHKIARGSRVTDMHAWERQDVEVDCSNCHGNRPHPEWAGNPALKPYNDHAAFIACETCHIPWTSGASRRIWFSTFGVTNGPEAQIPQKDPQTGVFEPYSVYGKEYSSRPVYRWFNGGVSMLAEPLNNPDAWDFQIANKLTPGAKIYPFRHVVNGMVMDRRGFGYDPDYSPQFTMAAALDGMAAPLKMMGFMRPEGMNDRERAVLGQFPNLLPFDKETYVKTGDVKKATSVGLGRIGMIMAGQDAWGMPAEQLASVGANFWSGDLLGLDLPNNQADPTFDASRNPTQVTGSFVSLSHAIKRKGLGCLDCHASASVLDFKALGYSDQSTQRLQTLLTRPTLLGTSRLNGALNIKITATLQNSYQLMYSTSLVKPDWKPLGNPNTDYSRIRDLSAPPSLLETNSAVYFKIVETLR